MTLTVPRKLTSYFIPSRDVIPGRLSCAHCRATFSVEFALRNDFKRASCPVCLCTLVRDLRFGRPTPAPPCESTTPKTQDGWPAGLSISLTPASLHLDLIAQPHCSGSSTPSLAGAATGMPAHDVDQLIPAAHQPVHPHHLGLALKRTGPKGGMTSMPVWTPCMSNLNCWSRFCFNLSTPWPKAICAIRSETTYSEDQTSLFCFVRGLTCLR